MGIGLFHRFKTARRAFALPKPSGAWRRTVAACAAAGALAIAGCARNAATGREMLTVGMPSRTKQTALGLQSAPSVEQQSGGALNNTVIQRYVEAVGMRLVHAIPPKLTRGFQFSYTAVNDNAMNAFALPGGPIFITKGLLVRLQNEAQLAFVLGHETGHVVAQHVAQQMAQQNVMSAALAATGYAAGKTSGLVGTAANAISQFAGKLVMLRFSRSDERQADQLGLRFMVHAGYNPQAAIQVMHILQSAAPAGSTPNWMQTHPSTPNRIVLLQNTINTKYAAQAHSPHAVYNTRAYQQNVLAQHP